MSKPNSPQQDELGALKWLMLAGALLYGLVALLTWPFRIVARHLPGRRDKLLRATVSQMREAMPSGQQLVSVLAAGDHVLEAKMDKRMRKMEKDLDRLIATEGWPEDVGDEDPWSIAIDILEKAKRIGGIDWRADIDSLKEELAPLLRRHGLPFDWAFLQERECESLKNENLLPIVANRLMTAGYVLAHVDEGSDNYLFALCTPDEFSRIETLSSGRYAIRRFDKTKSVV